MSLLSVEALSVELGSRDVVKDVSLSVERGEFVGLIGPNGAGKTSLLRALLGLVSSTGSIVLGGNDVRGVSKQLLARQVAYIAQDRDVAWDVPVEMVVGLGRSPYGSGVGNPSPQDRAAVETAMRRMDVEPLRRRAITELSGGEKARALIARALAQDTPLLLADEPVAGLDPAHQISLMRLFADLASEGRSVVASLHDLSLAARWCTRIVVLNAGNIFADGPPADVLTDELLGSVYCVTVHRGFAAGAPILQPLDLVSPPDESQA